MKANLKPSSSPERLRCESFGADASNSNSSLHPHAHIRPSLSGELRHFAYSSSRRGLCCSRPSDTSFTSCNTRQRYHHVSETSSKRCLPVLILDPCNSISLPARSASSPRSSIRLQFSPVLREPTRQTNAFASTLAAGCRCVALYRSFVCKSLVVSAAPAPGSPHSRSLVTHYENPPLTS